MLTVDEYLEHWKRNHAAVAVDLGQLTDAMRADAARTVNAANAVLQAFGEQRAITSGWRPLEVNRLIPNAAPRSNHVLCRAVDLEDGDGDLDRWLLGSALCHTLSIWQEHPSATKGWCHIQIVPYRSWKSGKPRHFYP